MKQRNLILSLLASALCVSAVFSNQAVASPGGRIRKEGSLILKIRDSASQEHRQELQNLLDRLGTRIEKLLLKGRALRLKNLNPQLEEEILRQLKQAAGVEFVEPDYWVAPTEILNDSMLSSSWHHAKIGSENAWKYVSGSKNVKVAVCDAGFDVTHPDLAPNFLLPGYNTVNNTNVVTNSNEHGTWTSGVIGAVGNNGYGGAGVSWQISMIPIQVSGQADGMALYSDIAECIQYAADQGAKVVNISYGQLYASSLINDAAKAMRDRGGLVVVSAGNDASDISASGESPNLLVVGATDSNDELASFSNYGKPVDLVAPGQSIFTTFSGARFGYVNGTSFAAPIVTGAAALLYTLNPSAQPALIESWILSTTDDLGPAGVDLKFAQGRVNVGAAVQKALTESDNVPPSVTFTSHRNGDSVSGNVAVSVSATDNVGVASVAFMIDGKVFATVSSLPYTANLDTTSLSNGPHTLTVQAKDLHGNLQEGAIQIQVSNSPPSSGNSDNVVEQIKDLFKNPWGRWRRR